MTVDVSTYALPVALMETIRRITRVLDDLFTPPNWFVLSLGQVLAVFWLPAFKKNQRMLDEFILLHREASITQIDKDVAYQLCSLLGESCEHMLVAENQLMKMQLHRLLFLRGPYQRLRQAREAMEDILEAHLLALDPEFDDLVNSALSEVVGQLEKEFELKN
jgi:hypothetical protein